MFTVVQLHHANIALPAWLDRGLRLFIVTPFMHKVHHSRWQPETDSNYSSLFSFWDRLFGTFRLRAQPNTLQFGLDDFDQSYADRSFYDAAEADPSNTCPAIVGRGKGSKIIALSQRPSAETAHAEAWTP